MQTLTHRAARDIGAPAPGIPGRDDDDLNLIGATRAFAADQEVFGEGERAEHVYKVVQGAVRTFRLLADGRRQICEFYLPGDVFGVECGPHHHEAAEAMVGSTLVVGRCGQPTRALVRLAMTELQRSQDHAVTLGRRSAGERLARFVLDLAERLDAADEFDLPMSRQDIADYLGLTIETVSRTLGDLQRRWLISIVGCRRVRILRRDALAELCQ